MLLFGEQPWRGPPLTDRFLYSFSIFVAAGITR
jgi:hypothetical protein